MVLFSGAVDRGSAEEEILNKLRGFEFRVDEAPVAPAYRSYGYDPRMAARRHLVEEVKRSEKGDRKWVKKSLVDYCKTHGV